MEIKTFQELKAINEALSPEEKKANRKARRDAKKGVKSKPTSAMSSDDDIYDMDDIDANPSKSMTQAVERFRTEQVKFQDLQKEFVLTPKNNIAKRESIKKKLVVQSKRARAAEADFEKMVSQEEGEYENVLMYESLDFMKMISEGISGSTVSKMDKAAKGEDKLMKKFLTTSDNVMELLYRDNDFDYEDVLDYLKAEIENDVSERVSSSTSKEMDMINKKNGELKAFSSAAQDIFNYLYEEHDFDFEDVIDYLVLKIESMHPSD